MTDTPMDTTDRSRTNPLLSSRGTAIPWFAVFKRELGLYFRSPIAYGVAFAIFFFLGVLFNGYTSAQRQRAGAFPPTRPTRPACSPS